MLALRRHRSSLLLVLLGTLFAGVTTSCDGGSGTVVATAGSYPSGALAQVAGIDSYDTGVIGADTDQPIIRVTSFDARGRLASTLDMTATATGDTLLSLQTVDGERASMLVRLYPLEATGGETLHFTITAPGGGFEVRLATSRTGAASTTVIDSLVYEVASPPPVLSSAVGYSSIEGARAVASLEMIVGGQDVASLEAVTQWVEDVDLAPVFESRALFQLIAMAFDPSLRTAVETTLEAYGEDDVATAAGALATRGLGLDLNACLGGAAAISGGAAFLCSVCGLTVAKISALVFTGGVVTPAGLLIALQLILETGAACWPCGAGLAAAGVAGLRCLGQVVSGDCRQSCDAAGRPWGDPERDLSGFSCACQCNEALCDAVSLNAAIDQGLSQGAVCYSQCTNDRASCRYEVCSADLCRTTYRNYCGNTTPSCGPTGCTCDVAECGDDSWQRTCPGNPSNAEQCEPGPGRPPGQHQCNPGQECVRCNCLDCASPATLCGDARLSPSCGEVCDPDAYPNGCSAGQRCDDSTCQCVPGECDFESEFIGCADIVEHCTPNNTCERNCGNGSLETFFGESCEVVTDCEPGERCEDCRCASGAADPAPDAGTDAGLDLDLSTDVVIGCDETQHAGGDTPETIRVTIGQSCGTFSLDYEMFSIPDQITVVYEGSAAFDTGCVCGSTSIDIPLCGQATEATVVVNPNCTPVPPGCSSATSGTEWNFSLSCPNP